MPPRAFVIIPLALMLGLMCPAQEPVPADKIVARYKQMLAANPSEGVALDRLWKIYQEKSATDKLLAEYREAAGKNDFASTLILGHLLRRAGMIPEATGAFLGAAALDAHSPLPHLALAQIHSDQTKPKEAADEYELAANLMEDSNPALADVLLKLGTTRFAAGDRKKAADAWERIVARDPSNLNLHKRLAENYIANSMPDKAIPHYETIATNGDPQQQTLALEGLARVYQMKGDEDLAIQSLEKAIALTAPGNWMRADLEGQLIREYQRSHRTADLERQWKKALEENPRDAGAYLQLIQLYERLGNLDEEAAVLAKLCALMPGNPDYKIKLAHLRTQLSQPDAAAQLLDEVLKAQPDNADVLFTRAEIDVQRDTPQAARDRIEALLRQHPEDDTLRARALDFYSRHRIFDAVEQHLKEGRDENSVFPLASFYFSQHREADAMKTLDQLVKTGDPVAKQAAAHRKIGGFLKEQKIMPAALEELKRAVVLQPASAEYHLALGDLLTGMDLLDAARPELEKGIELTTDEQAKADADSKLFHLFTMRVAEAQKPPGNVPALGDKLSLAIAVMRKIGVGAATSPLDPAQEYVDAMIADAGKNPTPAKMLRIARWENWRRKSKEAVDYAQKAVEMQPDSIPTREALVKVAAGEEKPVAIEQLYQLARMNPARETTYLRQISHLQMESGKPDEAVQILTDLEKSKPGDLEVVIDLASALQQLNRWDESLAAWQRAFNLAPSPRRKEIVSSLVRLMEKQGQNQEAAEALAKVTDEQSDEGSREAAFQDLLLYCGHHDLLPWLQSQYERKLRLNADDYFAQVALSKILKANGRDNESFKLLSDATISAPDQVAALRELVAETEEKGDFEAAAACQRRLLPLVQQEEPGDFEKLATLQENSLDFAGAGITWDKILTKFAREPDVLSKAAGFYQRWDFPEKARAALRKAIALAPDDIGMLMSLGRLAANAGDNREAIDCFEKVLQKSSPATDGGRIKFPGTNGTSDDRLQQTYFTALRLRNGQSSAEVMRALRSFWGPESERDKAEDPARLEAIAAISGILKKDTSDKSAMQKWLARWQDAKLASPTDALWAFYYSGANDLVFKQIDELMKSQPDNRLVKQGFVWLCLQTGEYERLSRWFADPRRTTEERDYCMVTFGQLVGNEQGKLDAKLVDGLFPPQFKSTQILWQVAVQLAARGYIAEAAKLGERVFAVASSKRPEYGLELAHWHLYIGDVEGARRILKASITGEGDSPASPVYSALREYYLLLPENERDAFVQSYREAAAKSPLHSAISLSLLHALGGNDEKAKEQVTKLIAMRPMVYRNDGSNDSPGMRRWNFILVSGLQYQQWKLNTLASYLWERALADEAAIQLEGYPVSEVVREIRIRLFSEKLAAAAPGEEARLLDDYVRSTAPEVANTLATLLENSGYYGDSIQVYRRLWRLQPGNQHFLQALLNVCRASNDGITEKEVLTEALAAVPQDPPDAAYLQAAVRLVQKLAADSDDRPARRVIEEALRFFPQNRELLLQAAALYARHRQYELAEKTYSRVLAMQPGDAATRDALLNTLEAAGRTDAAIDMLLHPTAPGMEDDAQLAKLCVKAGEFDKAEHAAGKVLQNRAYDKIPDLAAEFTEKGRNREAQAILLVALSRCKEANTLFNLESRLLENLPGDASPELVSKLMLRLKRYATASTRLQAQPVMRAAYYETAAKIAKKFHNEESFQKELAADWRNGAGQIGAGMVLAEFFAKSGQADKLRAVCEPLFARPDFNEPSASRLGAALEEAGQYSLLAKAWQAVAARNPLRHDAPMRQVRALVSAGKKEEASAALEKFGCRYVFDDVVAGEVAREYSREGDSEAADKWFAIVVKMNPDVRNGDIWIAYARTLLDRRNFAAAKQTLAGAFRNPSGRDLALLARYLIESGHQDRTAAEAREFALSNAETVELYGQLILYQQQHANPLAAISIAGEHPEIIALGRDIPKWLRAAATAAGAFPRVSGLLERALAQSGDESNSDIAGELALLYRDWPDPGAALDHLKRANELEPGNFEIAIALAKLHLGKSQPHDAAQVLTKFIALSQVQSEKDQAKTLLGSIPGGT